MFTPLDQETRQQEPQFSHQEQEQQQEIYQEIKTNQEQGNKNKS
jgi:hypothetical protein